MVNIYAIIKNDEVINRIVASTEFVEAYCLEIGASYSTFPGAQIGKVRDANGNWNDKPEAAKARAHGRLDMEFHPRYTKGFPAVDKAGNDVIIPIRSEADQLNINSVADAGVRKAKRDAAAVVKFRTEDGEVRTFDAAAFEQISLDMFDEKQAILHAYWAKQKEIEQLANDSDAYDNYDATTGWPV